MLAMIIISGILFYIFGGIFTFRAMIRLNIGVTRYNSKYTDDEYWGPVIGGIFWPFFWIGYSFYKIAGKLLDEIEKMTKGNK